MTRQMRQCVPNRSETHERYNARGQVIRKCVVCQSYKIDTWQRIPVESCGFTGYLYCCGYESCKSAIEDKLENAELGNRWRGVFSIDSKYGRDDDHVLEVMMPQPSQQPEATPRQSIEHRAASPTLKLQHRFLESQGAGMSREELKDALIARDGMVCQGCNREFDDLLFLEVDHIRPQSEGGEDHIGNRVLLCGPCNRIKSIKFTLSGLQDHNIKSGRMTTHPDTPQPSGLMDALLIGVER